MKLTKYLIGGLAALALAGCKDKLRELNTNPDTIGQTEPQYMFLNAMSDFDNPSRGAVATKAQTDGSHMQYFVYYDGASDGTYYDTQNLNSSTSMGMLSYYYDWFVGTGYSLASIMNYIDNDLDEAEAAKYQDLKAMCGIAKIYEAFRVFQNYGAAVYTQAFDAISDGITLPEYDIFDNEMYEKLDDELAGHIAVLEQPAAAGTFELGVYDPIYGYKLPDGDPVLGAPATRDNYAEQRTLWKKFGNSFRLYMAWIMKDVNGTRFDKVLAETLASGVYENAADGAFTYLNGGEQNGGIYNCAEAADISTLYSVSDNFVTYLKNLDDPRLPLLARANNLYAANTGLQWIQRYYPDSLKFHQVLNKETNRYERVSWDGVFDFGTYPMLAYQGQSPNPYDADKTDAGKFWGKSTFTLRFFAPGYKTGDEDHNKTLFPWTVTNPNDPSDTYTIKTRPDTSFTIEVCSRPQGRYFVAGGGSQYGPYDGQGRNGYDGTIDDRWSIYLRQPLYTYPEFCFMMAYLSADGVNLGTTWGAQEWYDAGVTAAMEELQGDAIRANVQVATNLEHTYEEETYGLQYINPEIAGINDNGVYGITDKIGSYVSSIALGSFSDQKAAIVGQMWIYSYMNPTRMWDWWRKTGYPTIKHVATPADRPTDRLPYWMEPRAEANEENVLEFPRRGALPGPKAANNANYNAARNELLKLPNYGSNYNDNVGRIFWDTQGL